MPHHRPTTIAILGANTVVENALSLLLGGAGYSTKVLEEPSASGANAEEQLVGVDLLLLTPSLREEDEEGFLRAIEATASAASGVPVRCPRPPRESRTTGRRAWCPGLHPWRT